MSPGYFANNAPRLVSYGLFALVNFLLFAWAVHAYAPHGQLVQLARGCGAVMNFNGAFCLLPMMRLFISRVRRTRCAPYLALEDSVTFHRVSGYTMFVAALVHTAAYLALYSNQSGPLLARLTTTLANQTGVLLLVVFVVLWAFAFGPVRRRAPFELFFVTHLLGVGLVVLLLLHSPNYWKWFLVGGSGYLADRAVRTYRMRRPSHITRARILPSRVTELTIARPPGWRYRAGDFIFVLLPAVSRFEWHPFTISSSPERADALTLHVRTLGDWTTRLHARAPLIQETRVFIDGPHGAPANDIFATRVPVLIAAGIGVTPFASILRSLLHRHQNGGADSVSVEKVHFLWLNRDQYAFEWFTELLTELALEDRAHLFDLRLFVTDPLEGELPPFTRQGRPDWEQELGRVATAHSANDVGLFYCGPRALARDLHLRCLSLGWRFREEHF